MIKNNAFFTILLTIITFNAYSMEPSDGNTTPEWITLAGKVLIDGTVALKDFLSYVYSGPTEQRDPFPFTDLPQDIQNTIISLVINNNSAQSLEDSAQAINALAQVNQQLNALINDPQFCLQIIQHLADQFDCSDATAAMALQTQQANKRLHIQMQCTELFITKKPFDQAEFQRFYEKYKDYIDLNFTYGSPTNNGDLKMTLLLLASCAKDDAAIRIKTLLQTEGVNVNCANKFGMTPLMLCTLYSTNPDAVKLLCHYPTININQQDINGNTAIMLLCKYADIDFNTEKMKLLLDNGADPEIADNNKMTPLEKAVLCHTDTQEDQDIIDLLEEAIHKKNNKK